MNVMMTKNFMSEAKALELKDNSDFAAIALKLSEVAGMNHKELQKLKVKDSMNDVYVIKHKNLRLFFTKNDENVVALSVASFN